MVFPHFIYFNGKGGICVTSKDVIIRLENLRYALDDVDILMRGLRTEWYEKGDYTCVLRIHTLCVRLYDLIEALDNLSLDEKTLLGGVNL